MVCSVVSNVRRLRLLMPDQGRAAVVRATSSSAASCDFHQHVHAQGHGAGFQFLQLRGGQRRRDQQHAVRAQGAGEHHLVGIDDEILAQYGQRAGRARLRADGRANPGRTARRSARERQAAPCAAYDAAISAAAEVFAQHAARRRCFLISAMMPDLPAAILSSIAWAKPRTSWRACGLAQQFGFAAHLARGGDFLGLDGKDLRKNVVHLKTSGCKRKILPACRERHLMAIVSAASFRPAFNRRSDVTRIDGKSGVQGDDIARRTRFIVQRFLRIRSRDSSRLDTLMLRRLDIMDSP